MTDEVKAKIEHGLSVLATNSSPMNMVEWDQFSNACLSAASERDALLGEVERLREALWGVMPSPRVSKLEESLREIVEACKKDFINHLTEGPNGYCPDNDPVAVGHHSSSSLTFGIIRRADAILSKQGGGEG